MAVGKMIPKQTVYIIGRDGTKTRKEPLYTLHSTEEEKAKQDKLGDSVGFWYGTWCEKCCGVYPKFFSEQGFKVGGYYVCMVCGKESTHNPMPWQSRDAWNNHEFAFKPEPKNGYQFTIYDYMDDLKESLRKC